MAQAFTTYINSKFAMCEMQQLYKMSKCSLIIHWPEQFEVTKVVSTRIDAIIREADSKQYDIAQRSQLSREKKADHLLTVFSDRQEHFLFNLFHQYIKRGGKGCVKSNQSNKYDCLLTLFFLL